MLSKAAFEKIALSFPGVEKGSSYGKPAFLIAKKFFTRIRDSDGSAVVYVESFDEREMLIHAEPEIFHLDPHYKDYPFVLARLSKLDERTLRGLLLRSWRRNAPKALLKDADSEPAAPSRPKPKAKTKAKTKKKKA